MIYGNLKDIDRYSFLKQREQEALKYAAQNALAELESGKHDVDGDRLYFNLAEYETKLPEEGFWEAHRQYVDIHVMLRGKEKIFVNFMNRMQAGEFESDKDYLPLEGSESGYVLLQEGDFLICYPEDAHMTGIMTGQKEQIKKAIFKVQI